MDSCDSDHAPEKHCAEETTRRPLGPADNKNGTTRRPRIREVNSRYRSPKPYAGTVPKRSPSPHAGRTSSTSALLSSKRAVSAERKLPSRPSSPSAPSTPVKDTSAEMMFLSKRVADNRLTESLWPSTMRSLSVSFQSDAISFPTSKREKPISRIPTERSLSPSSNIACRKVETPVARKPTPERKRSPVKGKFSPDHSENLKPVDTGVHARLVDQNRWPSRASGKVPAIASNGSIYSRGKRSKISSLSNSVTGAPTIRRLSLGGISKPLQKSASDLLMLISRDDSGKTVSNGCLIDDCSLRIRKPGSSSSSDRTLSVNAAGRAQALPIPGARPPSPPVSRGVSPSRTKAAPHSRGTSPVRVRPSSPSKQPQSSTSVLSFIADIKKGEKAASLIDDAHQVRLLYNRHLQWRYANARADAALHSQQVKAERMLYSVWRTILDLLDTVITTRIGLQHAKLMLKLYSILNNHLNCLEDWASVERDHNKSLTFAIQDLQISTIRIPLTGGARGDVETVKAAIFYAVEVMQMIRSSLCSIVSQVEATNSLVSELANISVKERAMLDECGSLMGTTTAFQVVEYSTKTHLFQMTQAVRNGESAVSGH